MVKKKPDGRNLIFSFTFAFKGQRITEETAGSNMKQAQWSMKQKVLKNYGLDLGNPYHLQLTFVRDKNKNLKPPASTETDEEEKLTPRPKPAKKPRVKKDPNLPLFDGWPPADDE